MVMGRVYIPPPPVIPPQNTLGVPPQDLPVKDIGLQPGGENGCLQNDLANKSDGLNGLENKQSTTPPAETAAQENGAAPKDWEKNAETFPDGNDGTVKAERSGTKPDGKVYSKGKTVTEKTYNNATNQVEQKEITFYHEKDGNHVVAYDKTLATAANGGITDETMKLMMVMQIISQLSGAAQA